MWASQFLIKSRASLSRDELGEKPFYIYKNLMDIILDQKQIHGSLLVNYRDLNNEKFKIFEIWIQVN